MAFLKRITRQASNIKIISAMARYSQGNDEEVLATVFTGRLPLRKVIAPNEHKTISS